MQVALVGHLTSPFGNIKMPTCISPRLQCLCIETLVLNWDRHYAKIQQREDGCCNVLQCLPEYLLHEIQHRLVLSRGIRSLDFKDFLLLITCRCMIRVDLRDFIIGKSESLQAIQCLIQRSANLRELFLVRNLLKYCNAVPQPITNNMDFQGSLHSTLLNLFLQNLPYLKILNAAESHCQNWMLKTIAKNCPLLQELDVSNCPDIDDDGVLAFCDKILIKCPKDEAFDKCQMYCLMKLKKLWLVGTRVSANAVVELLLTFPNLQLCHHPDLLNSVNFLLGPHWTNQQNIKSLEINPLLINIVCHVNWLFYLQEPSCLTRSISCLELSGLTPDVSLSSLSQLQNLESLTLRSCPQVHKCGVNLDRLVNSCQSLRHLTLNVKGPLVVTRAFSSRALQSLESLNLDRGGSMSLSATDALRLLNGCISLKQLRMNYCSWLTDKILDDLLLRNPLPRAKEIAFYESKLSFDGIIRLLHLPNKLRVLSVGTEMLGKSHSSLFNNYIRKRNWQLVLRLYTASSTSRLEY